MRGCAWCAARPASPPLRHSQPVDFFSGAAEVPGRVRLLDAEQLAHGSSGWVQFVLDAPVAVAPGDRFIIRQASPSLTLGGGNVVNPHPRRRWRRFQAELMAQLETLARGTPEDLVLHALQSHEPAPLKAVIEAAGWRSAIAEAVLAAMLESGEAIALGATQPPLRSSPTPAISLGGWRRLSARMAAILDDYHARIRSARAWRGRSSRAGSRAARSGRPSVFNELAALGVADGISGGGRRHVRRPGYRVTFTPERQARVDVLLAAYRSAALYAAVRPRMRGGHRAGHHQRAVAPGDAGAAERGRAAAARDVRRDGRAGVAYIGKNGSMTVAQVRDEFNTSRKYALALMEYLDNQKVTRRVGDLHGVQREDVLLQQHQVGDFAGRDAAPIILFPGGVGRPAGVGVYGFRDGMRS